jgi:hypothetical protein
VVVERRVRDGGGVRVGGSNELSSLVRRASLVDVPSRHASPPSARCGGTRRRARALALKGRATLRVSDFLGGAADTWTALEDDGEDDDDGRVAVAPGSLVRCVAPCAVEWTVRARHRRGARSRWFGSGGYGSRLARKLIVDRDRSLQSIAIAHCRPSRLPQQMQLQVREPLVLLTPTFTEGRLFAAVAAGFFVFCGALVVVASTQN